MACCRGAKRPIEFLLNQLSSRRQPGHCYSSGACRGNRVFVVKGVYSPTSFVRGDFKCPSGGLMFMRRFSVEVPASEQMNLIKQLRERTSAPIKDVKTSLVDCNWDIGNFILILC